MSIEAAVHEIIADASNPDAVALLALLPAVRIVTGTNHDRELPYAGINLESDQPEFRSASDTARRQRIRVQVWDENHASGVAIREAFAKLFENKKFTLTGRTLVTRFDNSLAIQEGDGVWQFSIDFDVQYFPD